MDSGTAAILVAVAAAIPGALAFFASRRKDDGDLDLRRDDAAWVRLQTTLTRQDSDLSKLRDEQRQLQQRFQEVAEHAERCDVSLAEARAEIAELRRRVDERP